MAGFVRISNGLPGLEVAMQERVELYDGLVMGNWQYDEANNWFYRIDTELVDRGHEEDCFIVPVLDGDTAGSVEVFGANGDFYGNFAYLDDAIERAEIQ